MGHIDDILNPYVPDYDFIISIINEMYYPADSIATSDELLWSSDLLQTLRNMDPQLTPKHLHEFMINMGFIVKHIEGFVYYAVMTK